MIINDVQSWGISLPLSRDDRLPRWTPSRRRWAEENRKRRRENALRKWSLPGALADYLRADVISAWAYASGGRREDTRSNPLFCYFTIRPGRSPDSTAGVDFWNSSCCCLFSTVFRWNFIDLFLLHIVAGDGKQQGKTNFNSHARQCVSIDRHGGAGRVGRGGLGRFRSSFYRGVYHAEVDRCRKYLMSNVMNDWLSSIPGIPFCELSSYREPFDGLRIFMSFCDPTSDIVGRWTARWQFEVWNCYFWNVLIELYFIVQLKVSAICSCVFAMLC